VNELIFRRLDTHWASQWYYNGSGYATANL